MQFNFELNSFLVFSKKKKKKEIISRTISGEQIDIGAGKFTFPMF